MEILLEGRFGRSYGWKYQIDAVRTPAITTTEDGPYCTVFFHKK